jgi:hypothetical protein
MRGSAKTLDAKLCGLSGIKKGNVGSETTYEEIVGGEWDGHKFISYWRMVFDAAPHANKTQGFSRQDFQHSQGMGSGLAI